ncbi:MAG: transglycosylase domain-containing protein [Dehalococcoidia bacterium]|nr:transglycosylase domain-containing protein [Dehalococcoidia bacterium]
MNALAIRKRRVARRASRKGGGAGRWFLIAFLSFGFLMAVGAAASAAAGYALYQHYAEGYVRIEEKLNEHNVGLTEIYDRNGIFLGQLSNPDAQLLAPVPLAEIAPAMIESTISTEDDGFYDHPGFSWTGLLRAAKERYIDKDEDSGSGGSSITQQLVKNVYICPSIVTSDDKVCAQAERTVSRKLKEIAYAIELEHDYSKDQILEYYLNSISYADRYIGVQAAAQGYFRKNAIDLTLAESALLAGIPSYPTLYHPRNNCVTGDDGRCLVDEFGRTTVGGEAKKRQETVLDLMVEHGRITQVQADEAKAELLAVYPAASALRAPAFIDNQIEPRLVRMCDAGLLPLLDGATDCIASVHSAGYQVTTTLDIVETEKAQAMIADFIATGLENGCNCHNAAIATIDPTTGEVIVYAPNIDRTNTTDERVKGQVDQLTEINQPGSSFKPVVYLALFEYGGMAPMSAFWDNSPLKVEGVEITNPRGGDPKSEGLISVRAALGGSQNVGAFRSAETAGVDNVIEMAKKVGITTLDQHFDPTFVDHEAVTYGASIATGGANIRAIDLAYANSVFANMGVMVGVPTLAQTVDIGSLKGTYTSVGLEYDRAREQAVAFSRGNIRIPGTRELDPVVVLTVTDRDGNVLYDHASAGDLQRVQVVDAGSVWLVHSIISDCTSRFIIWGCGSSNDDLSLDAYVNGVKIPSGVKTGTQQGPLNAVDTLETWMNGYSRSAATSVWVGNANNELVRDGPSANYAAANTTVRLFKNWMGEYHAYLQDLGVITEPLGFADLQPANVARVSFQTPSTDRGLSGGCSQFVTAWVRTDMKYDSLCYKVDIDTRNGLLAGADTPAQYRKSESFVKPPTLHPDGYTTLARQFNIPLAPTEVSKGQVPVVIQSPGNGRTLRSATPVVATVDMASLKRWKLEIGSGASPSSWSELASGSTNVRDAIIGVIDAPRLEAGVYTIRLTATGDATIVGNEARVTFNVDPLISPLFPTPTPGGPGTLPGGQLPGIPTPTPFRR